MAKKQLIRNPEQEIQALQDTIYVIGGKWKLPIINSLCNGNRRFREIQRSIPGITTRMLSKELKEMELNKIIVRKVYDASPVAVEYETTPYCKTFGNIILAMIDWGKKHKKMITSPNSLLKEGTKNLRKSEPGARKMQKL